MNTNEFIDSLKNINQDIKNIYNDHISDYDEILEHLLLADITRYLISNIDKSNNQTCIDLIGFINTAYSKGDDGLKELVSLSFLENLPQSDKSYSLIKEMLSNELKKELVLYEY